MLRRRERRAAVASAAAGLSRTEGHSSAAIAAAPEQHVAGRGREHRDDRRVDEHEADRAERRLGALRARAPPLRACRAAPSRRWVRWSRPPVRTPTPRRSRETTTSVVSRISSPTSGTTANTRRCRSRSSAGTAMTRGGEQEADRHAAAVAEEDPRRAGEVEAQEAEAGARRARAPARRQRCSPLRDGEDADARRGHAADACRRRRRGCPSG